MRFLIGTTALLGTPAFAHHEVIVVTSALSVLGGLALVLSAGAAALFQKLQERKSKRREGSIDPSRSRSRI